MAIQFRTLSLRWCWKILLDFNLSDKTLLADSLSELAGRKINVQTKPRGDRARYLKLARTNAATALTSKLSQQSTVHQRLTALASVLKLPEVKRMECFDISHTMGEQTVASCVVFDANGPLRAEYRRYNITGITPGDDYAAMNQVLRRRYGKAIDDSKIHTSRKIHASISSQKAETLNRGIAGRRADLSPLSSRGVGNLNTKTPVLFYCSAVNFCSSCSSRDGSQSATIICNPILNNIRYCCCASCTSPASSVNCAARYWR